jgi:hypothetical protein
MPLDSQFCPPKQLLKRIVSTLSLLTTIGYLTKGRDIVAAPDEGYQLRDPEIVFGSAHDIQKEETAGGDGENEIPWNTGIALEQ